MDFQHRKLIKNGDDDCNKPCKPCLSCGGLIKSPSSHVPKSVLVTGFVVGGVLLICVALIILKRYFSRRNASRETNLPILIHTQQDFVDEDHGPVIDHPIWYINTVGLPQSVIDSITACQYKKDEGLIEGTECSVCLSEFEEGESVRLLPKCSHAFHLSCIDTWLRSHKNCPLCRAPIVRDIATGTTPHASVVEPSSNDILSSAENTQMGTSENDGLTFRHQMDEEESSEVSVRVDVSETPVEFARNGEDRITGLCNSVVRCCDSRALSDLADNREVVGEDRQPMRRSVSMDASSAVAIYHAVANVVPDQGSSNSQLAVPVKSSSLAIVSKQVTQNLSLYKLMRSASIGRSLKKGPTSMKRSYSSSRKFFPSKHGRSLSSILPS